MWRCSDGPTAGQGPAAEPPSSPFYDDQVLGVRPEPRRVRDLDPPGNRAVGRRRGRQRARVLTRYDAVFLVGRGERDLGQGPAIHRREGGGIEGASRSEEHTSELQSRLHLVCRLLLEKKKNISAESRLVVVIL